MDAPKIAVDPIDDGIWRFELHGHRIEVQRHYGYIRIDDGTPHASAAVKGLAIPADLAGAPLAAITQLLEPTAAQLAQPIAPSSHEHHADRDLSELARDRSRSRKPISQRKRSVPPSPKRKPIDAFNTASAARYLGLSPKTLETQRSRGDGPPFIKLGRRVVYRQQDLDDWLAARRRKSTSDTGAA